MVRDSDVAVAQNKPVASVEFERVYHERLRAPAAASGLNLPRRLTIRCDSLRVGRELDVPCCQWYVSAIPEFDMAAARFPEGLGKLLRIGSSC